MVFFLFATGSAIDEVLGVSPADRVVVLGGVNGTGDAVTTMNGSGNVATEDVEAAKWRRWYRKGLLS